jgi:hypothetical protein
MQGGVYPSGIDREYRLVQPACKRQITARLPRLGLDCHRLLRERIDAVAGRSGGLLRNLKFCEARQKECSALFEFCVAYVRKGIQHALDLIAADIV